MEVGEFTDQWTYSCQNEVCVVLEMKLMVIHNEDITSVPKCPICGEILTYDETLTI